VTVHPPDRAGDADTAPALGAAVRTTGAVTLLSRFAGLARDVIVVRIFGDTATGSAFAAAFAIPNTFRRLFGEGALSAAFLPAYAQAEKHNPSAAARFASLVVAWLGLVTAALTVLIETALLVLLLAVDHPPDRVLSLQLIMVMLPFMPLICMAAIMGGMLQVHGRFGPAASGPIILNAFIIAVGAWHLVSGTLAAEATAYVLGAATVLSGLTQAAWFFLLLRTRWAPPRIDPDARERVRVTLRRFVPVALGLGTLQLNGFVDMLLAMWPIWVGPTLAGRTYPLDEASNVILASAQKLYQFPLGVFGIAVAAAVFPMLARAADERERFERILRRGVRLSLFIGVPASAGLVLVRHDVTMTLFGGGRSGFSDEGVVRAAAVVLGFAPAVWAYSVNHVLTRAFYARGDTATPVRVALAAVALNLCLNVVLIWPLREAGLAWSTAASAMAQTAALMHLCRRKFGVSPLDAEATRGVGRILLTAGLMGAAAWLAGSAAEEACDTLPSWWRATVRLAAVTGLGALSYLALARLLRAPELHWLLARSVSRNGDGHA
jgi:putative peptidoglycan lipid II flippase